MGPCGKSSSVPVGGSDAIKIYVEESFVEVAGKWHLRGCYRAQVVPKHWAKIRSAQQWGFDLLLSEDSEERAAPLAYPLSQTGLAERRQEIVVINNWAGAGF